MTLEACLLLMNVSRPPILIIVSDSRNDEDGAPFLLLLMDQPWFRTQTQLWTFSKLSMLISSPVKCEEINRSHFTGLLWSGSKYVKHWLTYLAHGKVSLNIPYYGSTINMYWIYTWLKTFHHKGMPLLLWLHGPQFKNQCRNVRMSPLVGWGYLLKINVVLAKAWESLVISLSPLGFSRFISVLFFWYSVYFLLLKILVYLCVSACAHACVCTASIHYLFNFLWKTQMISPEEDWPPWISPGHHRKVSSTLICLVTWRLWDLIYLTRFSL